jgi:type II pantothenate kinase
MGMVIGLDIGGSTTKIVGLRNGEIFGPILVKATDPVASAFGALGKFLSLNRLELGWVDRIMVTGVGSSFLHGELLGLHTIRVPEFLAIGLGGLHLSGLKEAVVVSMGTGTAFVKADEKGIRHLGGSGVGGGTLLGLANRMLNVRDFDLLVELAVTGDLSRVDLMIGDITQDEIPGLSSTATASNFGRISDGASREDVALGIVNLVFQTIGVMAVMVSRDRNPLKVVLTGNLTIVPQAGKIFTGLADLFSTEFLIPPLAEYATAIGAALCTPDKGSAT